MSRVINRKNVTIVQDLNDVEGVFTVNMNSSFKPDTMIVKHITYGDPSEEEKIRESHGMFLIRCSAVNDYIGSISDSPFGNTSVSPNLVFDVSNCTFNTEWRFSIHLNDHDIDNDTIFPGDLVIHLEFTQHQ